MPPPASAKRNWKNVSLRLYAEELRAVLDLCEVLTTSQMKVEPSFILMTAAIEEASFLGFPPSTTVRELSTARTRPAAWPYAPPERHHESFSERLTITAHPLEIMAVRNAAHYVGLVTTRFILGALWRFIAKRQKAEPGNRRLQSIAVPPKYRA